MKISSIIKSLFAKNQFSSAPESLYPQMALEYLLPSLDMKPDTERVDDQKQYGSCVAHAGQTALEIMLHRGGHPTDLSRMYLYYYVQKEAGTLGTYDGGHTGALGAIINNYGCCLESTYPYVQSALGAEPNPASVQEGKLLFPNGCQYSSVGGVEEIKRALNQGTPVVITMSVQDGFYGLGNNWKLHTWDTTTPTVGYHAVCVIGYDDESERLLIENSWGPNWGDGGFFGMPYSTVPRVVKETFKFDKLHVPTVPFPGYIAPSLPEFDWETKILSIPKLIFIPSFFGQPSTFVGVRIKFSDVGNLTVGGPMITGLGAYFNFAPFMKDGEKHLGFDQINFRGTTYSNVLFVNASFEVLTATKIK